MPTVLAWRRSSFSGGGGNCVEAALLPTDHFALRDSKNPAATLTFRRVSLHRLTGMCIVYDVRRGDE
jgi:hypothetical protein